MKLKNITLLNPFVRENFIKKYEFDNAVDMKKAYIEFVKENYDIISKIDELAEQGDMQSITEQYGFETSSYEVLNEAKLGKKVHVKPSYSDDDFETDAPFAGSKTITGKITQDDIEAAQAAKSTTVIKKAKPIEQDVDIKSVRNIAMKTNSLDDIHHFVQATYIMLCDEHRNNNKATELSLLDTEAVTEMDAVFAFMDLPNIDLSTWDTSNVVNMEGMFYKSSFNNDSIQNWDVHKVTNMRNMFNGAGLTDEKVISGWYPATKNHALPKLGIGTNNDNDLDDSTAIKRVFGVSDENDIQKKYNARMGYNTNESWHVMSSSEFIAEGKFGDFMKKTANKIKSAINLIMIKTRNGISYVFDKLGNMWNVITAKSTIDYIKENNIQGVVLGEDWQPNETGYYEDIEKGSPEYENFLKFLDSASSSGNVNEARVTLSSNMSKADGAPQANIRVRDWNSEQLEKYLEKVVSLTQRHPGREKQTIVIWGAPGIGKSSIPKTLIKDMNEKAGNKKEESKMTVIVADCSQMSSDGFSLPTPAKQLEINKIVQGNAAAKGIAAANGMTEDELNEIDYKVSSDAPKTWLPVYKPTGDKKKDEILNALANGSTQPHYDKDGYIDYFVKTGAGGILLIDEFLRADQNVFFTVCQLMFNYSFGEYKLGDKWQIIAASNRPSDDKEVRKKWADSAGAGWNRLLHINFVPTFTVWKKWAVKNGFDETTLAFIAEKPFDGPDSRWHNFDPELKTAENDPLFASPRSWANAIKELKDECEYMGYSNYGEIPKKEFFDLVAMALPEKLAQEYTDYYFINSSEANPYSYDKVIAKPSMKVKDKSKYKCANVISNFVTTVQLRYNKNNRIPVDEFAALMEFLCNNYTDSNIIYENFYDEIYKICAITAPEEGATEEQIAIENSYDKVGEIFASAFPEFVEALGEIE